jgi:glutamate decarboxylase
MRRRSTLGSSPIFKKKATDHFDENHSLQAKTGKTHAVC